MSDKLYIYHRIGLSPQDLADFDVLAITCGYVKHDGSPDRRAMLEYCLVKAAREGRIIRKRKEGVYDQERERSDLIDERSKERDWFQG